MAQTWEKFRDAANRAQKIADLPYEHTLDQVIEKTANYFVRNGYKWCWER